MDFRSIYFLIFVLISIEQLKAQQDWQLKFEKHTDVNPILVGDQTSTFICPYYLNVTWESMSVMGPSAVSSNGTIYLFYAATDANFQTSLGRIGVVISEDGGITFNRPTHAQPLIYPDHKDEFSRYEFDGGCNDPRIVETESGNYLMTYTASRYHPRIFLASSSNLMNWTKLGFAFNTSDPIFDRHTSNGAIVTRRVGERLVATKINGKYWMYHRQGVHVFGVYLAYSDDLLSWTQLADVNEEGIDVPRLVFGPREGMCDDDELEPGTQAILMDQGIFLIYYAASERRPESFYKSYSSAQILLDAEKPWIVLDRAETCFLRSEEEYEISAENGTYGKALLPTGNSGWRLYYDTNFSKVIAVASSV